MNFSIITENLSKSYSIKSQKPLTLKEAISAFFSKPKLLTPQKNRIFLALNDLNIRIKKGEIVGIIGKNGSGKSTFLKLLSKITFPTKGSIRLFGKVASLLEVGAGFHPELTGIENVFLAGAIMGLTKKSITEKLPDIIAFSGLDEFIHLPVKKYSSGMFLKLGFAVIAHLDAEILLIDEILSIADASFQKKCLKEIKTLSPNKTIIYVSHHLETVRELCTRTLILDKGKLLYDGPTTEALARFTKIDELISV